MIEIAKLQEIMHSVCPRNGFFSTLRCSLHRKKLYCWKIVTVLQPLGAKHTQNNLAVNCNWKVYHGSRLCFRWNLQCHNTEPEKVFARSNAPAHSVFQGCASDISLVLLWYFFGTSLVFLWEIKPKKYQRSTVKVAKVYQRYARTALELHRVRTGTAPNPSRPRPASRPHRARATSGPHLTWKKFYFLSNWKPSISETHQKKVSFSVLLFRYFCN